MTKQTNRTHRRGHYALLVGLTFALATGPNLPAVAQVDDSVFDELKDAIVGYAEDMNRAMPCIYIGGGVIREDGEDRFGEMWGEEAVAAALEAIDELDAAQETELFALFQETYSPIFAVDDVRELTRSCFAADGEEPSILMQLRMLTGVGLPLEFQLDRIAD